MNIQVYTSQHVDDSDTHDAVLERRFLMKRVYVKQLSVWYVNNSIELVTRIFRWLVEFVTCK